MAHTNVIVILDSEVLADDVLTSMNAKRECTLRVSYADNYVYIDNQSIVNSIEDCSFHADCHDRDGDFYCECIFGFEGNGQDCTDIDECIEGSSDRSGTKGRYDPNSSPNVCSGRGFKLIL